MMGGSGLRLKKKTAAAQCDALEVVAPTKSQRSQADAQAPLGVATTRVLDRVMAAMGMLHGAPLEFEVADDVPNGGV